MKAHGGGILLALSAVVVALGIGELLVRAIAPQATMRPALAFDERYGILPRADVRIRHRQPGRFDLTYSTNQLHHRGTVPDPSTTPPRVLVVVLGDSRGFGMGVQDGEDFPAVLGDLLGETHAVLSLASPGWGLTQQVRRYEEIARPREPHVVVLQLNANDVLDGEAYPVTAIESGAFAFRNLQDRSWLAGALAGSPLQESHLYVVVRNAVLRLAEPGRRGTDGANPVTSPGAQRSYVVLLEFFARRVQGSGASLHVIALESDLELQPVVRTGLDRLAIQGLLRLEIVDPWLDDLGDYRAPEGHLWNAAAHARVAAELAERI